jgi:threonine aldolase
MSTRNTIDLRSDTVTKPSPAMRAVMAAAEVGDDVIDVDPTVRRLEQRIADLLGKENAIFMPSGTMTNQVALRVHCKPGDEFICEEDCHIYNYEQGAFAQLSGLVARTILGDRGDLKLSHLHEKVRPLNEHMVRTRLLCLENTHNRASGRVIPFESIRASTAWAHERGLATHLDGARLFNAVVASGISADRWCQEFDTVSVCFSKGLGAPVGSALAGSQAMIAEARWHRKVFGGGMRQAGILAAAALFALEENIERLEEDHRRAQTLLACIQKIHGITPLHQEIKTNIVIFSINPDWGNASEFARRLEQHGVLAFATSSRNIRLVTHLDLHDEQIERACHVLQTVAASFA